MSVSVEEPRQPYIPGFRYDWLLPLYDPLQKVLGLEAYHRQLVEQADLRPGQRVLEIGCGTGNLALLIKHLQPDADVVGLDPDPQALARAARKARRAALPVRLERGFAQALPYPDRSFDRVFSAFMFHHLGPQERERMLREARRVLAPGGALHLLDFGAAKVRADGVVARLAHRNARLRDNFGDRIPTLMREAGFADPTELAHRVTKVLGRVTYYRGTVPRAASGAA